MREAFSLQSHLVRDVLVLVQEHFQLADADVQVSVRELVGNVEAQWAELPSFQSDAVEETQGQEQRLEEWGLETRAQGRKTLEIAPGARGSLEILEQMATEDEQTLVEEEMKSLVSRRYVF